MASLRKYWPKDQTPCLYRHFDGAGRLLYIGITDAIVRRTKEHRRAHWHSQIARIEVARFATYGEAAEAERKAIRSENPLYNDGENQPPELLPVWDAREDCSEWQCNPDGLIENEPAEPVHQATGGGGRCEALSAFVDLYQRAISNAVVGHNHA